MDNDGLKDQLNTASESVYFMSGNGPNYTIKIGRVSQDPKEIVKNISMALPKVLGNVTCWDDIKFDKVQQISLKIDDSVELPIYNFLNEEDIKDYVLA